MAAVKAVTDAVDAVIGAKDGNLFGRTGVFLEGRRAVIRTEETNLGNLTADANLAAVRATDPAARAGMTVAARDLDGDGAADLLTGSGPGAAAEVRFYRDRRSWPPRSTRPRARTR